MNLLRCATLTVSDVDATALRFGEWLDYSVLERGEISTALATAWGVPASAGKPYCICQPSSGAGVYLRFIAGDTVPDYRPIRTFGWAAIEICVEDVIAVNARMQASPFEIIGPPKKLTAGSSTIYPMQVRGHDQEIVYLTEIIGAKPGSGLPVAEAMIDKLFIMVLACKDMVTTADWFRNVLGLDISEPMAIPYSMIAKAFDLPATQLHTIVTASWGDDIFLEFDQYPADATPRPCIKGALPPGVAICTISHPDCSLLDGHWFSPPAARTGAVYGGRKVGVLKTPEGALVEVVDSQQD